MSQGPDLLPDLLPDLVSLRLLAAVARFGSIGAAGRATGMTQQSASERLRAAEAQTGLVLVERAARGSRLTPAGRLLVQWSVPLLERAGQVETALRALQPAGREPDVLRVHASTTAAEHLLPRWLDRLRHGRPVRVALHAAASAAVLAAVRAGAADVGFVERPGEVPGLATAVVGRDRLVLVAAPGDPWAQRRAPLDARQVAARPLTWRGPGSETDEVVREALRAAGLEPAPAQAEVASTAAQLAAVRAGGAPAFVSDLAVRRALAAGALVEVGTGLDLRRALTAVWVGDPEPPAGALRDLLAVCRPAVTG